MGCAMMRRLWLIPALLLLSSTAAFAQARSYPGDVLDDILLVFDIIDAYSNEVDVDSPIVRAAAYPGRTFADFDRNRSGGFYVLEDGFGLNDSDLAVVQFIHDPVDADGDGLIGFYELECERAGGPGLDPDAPQTVGGVNDGMMDCDGDSMPSAWEARYGLDPLSGEDGDQDLDGDGMINSVEGRWGLNPRAADTDGDGVDDNVEVDDPDNPRDLDGDGLIDAMDPDGDGDGVDDVGDNCREVANPDQADTDGDGDGDACDAPPADGDGDGVPDDADNCPDDANADQADTDGNGVGDACDAEPDDTDGDGVPDFRDNCPDDANADQDDADRDGEGDVCDDTPNGGVGDGPSVRGSVFLTETLRAGDVFGLVGGGAEFADYDRLPVAAAPARVAGDCYQVSFAAGDPGIFDAVEAGDLDFVDGAEDTTLLWNPVSRAYELDTLAVLDLWLGGDEVTMSGTGSDRVGPFAVPITAPTDAADVSPDANGAFSRGGTTIEWTPGAADVVMARMRVGDVTAECVGLDTGSMEVPAEVFGWFDVGADRVSRFEVHRISQVETETAAPVGIVNVSLTHVYSDRDIPLAE